jgi:hypothetical protein
LTSKPQGLDKKWGGLFGGRLFFLACLSEIRVLLNDDKLLQPVAMLQQMTLLLQLSCKSLLQLRIGTADYRHLPGFPAGHADVTSAPKQQGDTP